jgi:hypothetical protein
MVTFACDIVLPGVTGVLWRWFLPRMPVVPVVPGRFEARLSRR